MTSPAAGPRPVEARGSDAGTIVLVEDDAPLRRLLATALQRAGYAVDAHAGAVSAVDAVRRAAPLLVLTDLEMPVMNGFELAARIREVRPDVPILFMSGYHPGTAFDEDDPTRTVDLIEKPFTIDELLRRVTEAIRGGGS